MEFSVPDMSCGHCRAAIEKAVKAADPAAKLEFDMGDRKVRVDSALGVSALSAAIKDAGYDSTSLAA